MGGLRITRHYREHLTFTLGFATTGAIHLKLMLLLHLLDISFPEVDLVSLNSDALLVRGAYLFR